LAQNVKGGSAAFTIASDALLYHSEIHPRVRVSFWVYHHRKSGPIRLNHVTFSFKSEKNPIDYIPESAQREIALWEVGNENI